MAHFLLVYRPPRPTFIVDATEEEARVIDDHFQYLKTLLAQGKLIIAGPCEDGSMGLAVVECESEAEAQRILAADPALQGGVFTGESKPYRVSLMRKS
jgi:uncharacterized protein YciI